MVDAPSITLIVGLGNPGKRYEATRHNAGFWFLEALSEYLSVSDWKTDEKFFGSFLNLTLPNHHKGWLLRPATYMNDCGRSVAAFIHFYRIPTQNILVIHDELDLPAGVAQFKKGGGHAGHNGLKSLFRNLDSPDFWRIRIGIQKPLGTQQTTEDYVLGKPNLLEKKQIDGAIEKTLSVFSLIFEDMEKAVRILHNAPNGLV